ncbi:hypothetical protein VM1G_08726 [Cytospora mali]|uniref:MFS maltose permease n=1 Tax=Cytospora mali TaxID=578113 RepID=A0A194WAV8_CYTMA|nr:hypothetical protein VM1G_08726 [Valsa mali]
MRPRLIRRILVRHHKSPTNNPKAVRTFTQNSPALYNARPQLPFLSIPSRFQRQQWRYLTTERKTWLKREAILGVKYTGYIWAILACVASATFAIQQERMEHDFPTPHEWSFRSRMLKRGADYEKNRTDVVVEDWVRIVQMLTDVIDRLEDPKGDGKGLKDLGPDAPAGSKDITAMPEPWRRGYYEALLLQALAAEHVEGWVVDQTRNVVFAPDVVRGPSNPFPKPIPPGSKSPPREEDCVPAGFPNPDGCYLKLLSTEGFTTKQRMDAALAYANWLEYKGLLGPAAIIYDDAVNMAIEEIYTPGAPPLINSQTAVMNDKADRTPSANLLHSLTALATFKARHEDVSAALPIMISILKARRSLPSQLPSNSKDASLYDAIHSPSKTNDGPLRIFLNLLKAPSYPPPPPDGNSPPVRDSKELCEEAALHLHIGEIMYTLQSAAREDGLAWTREGVDLAEEELHKVLQENGRGARDAKKTCRECLASGLDNWATMVNRMVKDEQAARESGQARSSAGWFGLWSGGKAVEEEAGGRWAAEQKVVTERTLRAQQILEDLHKPANWSMASVLTA